MEELSRTERLLAMILLHEMQEMSQGEKMLALHRAGLGNSEIAELVGSTAASVNQQLYTARRAKKVSSKKTSNKK